MKLQLIRILHKTKLLRFLKICVRSKINNRSFRIPLIGNIGYNNLFQWELWMMDLLQICINEEHAKFVDVGANIGQTLLKVKAINQEVEYIGFEPNPACLNYLYELIRVNRFQHVSIIPVGLAKITGLKKLTFYNENLDDGSASMMKDFRPTNKVYKKENIPVFDYNELSRNVDLEGISILKIDVEGAEHEVIRTLFEVIEQNKPIIFIEILPIYSNVHSERLERQTVIENILKELNYCVLRVFPSKEKILLVHISEIGIHSDINHCDYICIPRENLENFKLRSTVSQKIEIQE